MGEERAVADQAGSEREDEYREREIELDQSQKRLRVGPGEVAEEGNQPDQDQCRPHDGDHDDGELLKHLHSRWQLASGSNSWHALAWCFIFMSDDASARVAKFA